MKLISLSYVFVLFFLIQIHIFKDYLSIFIYFVTLKTEYYAKGCVRENKSKKFKVRIKRMTVRNENR